MSSPAVATNGNVFFLAVDGGDWADSYTWLDAAGNHGMPGPNDLVIIAASVTSQIDVQVAGMILQFGHFRERISRLGNRSRFWAATWDRSRRGPIST